MRASDIMVRQVIKAKEEDTVESVLEKFVDHQISGMPIVNDRNEIVGFISDGDIMRWIGKNPPIVFDTFLFSGIWFDQDDWENKFDHLIHMRVLEVATQKVVTVGIDTEINEIAGILGKKQIKKVPVERNGVLVGIISRGDVIRSIAKYHLKRD